MALPGARGSGSAPRALRAAPGSKTLLVLFLVLATGIVASGIVYYTGQRQAIMARTRSGLSTIRDLKVAQIVQYREALMSDGKAIADDPRGSDETARWLASPDERTARPIRAWLDKLVRDRQYSSAVVVGRDGAWIATTGGRPPGRRDRAEVDAVRASGEPTLTDLFLDEYEGKPQLDVVAPTGPAGDTTGAVLVLHRDPRRFFFPTIQSWPTPSPTSETLLIRREGPLVAFLNELRFRKGTALKFRLPLSNASLPAARAVRGAEDVVQGSDYRGRDVLAAVGRIPDSPWFIVAKVDTSEAYASLSTSGVTSLAAVALLVVALGLAFGIAWRQRAAAFYRQYAEAEHTIAETLQEGLLSLPAHVHGIEFASSYHSATEGARAGGDFYDIFELSGEHVGVTIGDVAGKGLQAAMLTSLVKNTVRAHATAGVESPSRILELTNDVVFQSTDTEVFVTVFFGVIDVTDGRLRYANAGHTSGFLLGRGGALESLPITGPILGAFPAVTYRESEAVMGTGGTLFLYTDGLTEARRDGLQFGEERLTDALGSAGDVSVAELVAATLREVTAFAGDTLDDDLAILALSRTDPGRTA